MTTTQMVRVEFKGWIIEVLPSGAVSIQTPIHKRIEVRDGLPYTIKSDPLTFKLDAGSALEMSQALAMCATHAGRKASRSSAIVQWSTFPGRARTA